MKTRPIIFGAPMVRAILEGRKTVTRRVVKPQPSAEWSTTHALLTDVAASIGRKPLVTPKDGVCPYGVPGERLYVKEPCWIWGRWTLNGLTKTGRQRWRFRAEPEHRVRFNRPERAARRESPQPGFDGLPGWVYRHARFMPRWASRITLEVVSVRVERVREITKRDAMAEGIPQMHPEAVHLGLCAETRFTTPHRANGPTCRDEWDNRTSVENFRSLWDSINAKHGFGWDANPWVWVIEFRRLLP